MVVDGVLAVTGYISGTVYDPGTTPGRPGRGSSDTIYGGLLYEVRNGSLVIGYLRRILDMPGRKSFDHPGETRDEDQQEK